MAKKVMFIEAQMQNKQNPQPISQQNTVQSIGTIVVKSNMVNQGNVTKVNT
jgi:hypothetical protein